MASKTSSEAKQLARHKFEGAWVVIRDELIAHFKAQNMPVDATEWYKRVSSLDKSPIESLLTNRL